MTATLPQVRAHPAPATPRIGTLVGVLGAATIASLALALRAPLATTVLGLILFGLLHNVLEIRYVAGRFATILTGRFLALLLVLITGVVLCRVALPLWPAPARYGEVVLGYLVLLAGCRYGLRGLRLVLAVAVLVVAAAASLRWPGWHFVMLTHLHNMVPLLFLWEWARRLPSRAERGLFRGSQIGWVLIIPALLLAGVADRLIVAAPGVVERFVGAGTRVVAASAPPAADVTMGLRFLAVFAFMQTMHYVVWVGFLPRYAPEATSAFEHRVPWLRGWRIWALGGGAGVLLAVVFGIDYAEGRSVYAALASYHAYLEFPVLLAMLMGQQSLRPAHVQPERCAEMGT